MMCISHSVMQVWYGIVEFNVPEASDIITPLTRVAFVYNGPKWMELAPIPQGVTMK